MDTSRRYVVGRSENHKNVIYFCPECFFHSYIYTKQVEVFIFKFQGDLAWGVAPSKSAIFCQYSEIIMIGGYNL